MQNQRYFIIHIAKCSVVIPQSNGINHTAVYNCPLQNQNHYQNSVTANTRKNKYCSLSKLRIRQRSQSEKVFLYTNEDWAKCGLGYSRYIWLQQILFYLLQINSIYESAQKYSIIQMLVNSYSLKTVHNYTLFIPKRQCCLIWNRMLISARRYQPSEPAMGIIIWSVMFEI